MNEKTPWYISSEDPVALSLTIKGLLMMYIPFILMVSSYFNFPLSNDTVVHWITMISFLISASMIVYGFIRKMKNWMKSV